MNKLFKFIKLLRGLRHATGRGHHRSRAYYPLHHRQPSLAERLLRRLTGR